MGNIPARLQNADSCHSTSSKRLRNREFFEPAIEAVRKHQLPPPKSVVLRRQQKQLQQQPPPSLLPLSAAPASTKTLCCVRKRPLLQKELDLRDYDVFSASSDLSSISIRSDVGGTPSDGGGTGGVGGGRNNSDADGGGDGSVDPSSSSSPPVTPAAVSYSTSSLWAHKGEFKLDNRQMYLQHHGYRFHDVFDEQDDSAEVYRRAIAPMVCCQQHPRLPTTSSSGDAAGTGAEGRRGGGDASNGSSGDSGNDVGCVLFYGQSGSGKTFTQEAVVDLALQDMFDAASSPSSSLSWHLSCYEIYADKVADLLQARAPVQLRQDAAGKIHAVGGSERWLSSIEVARDTLRKAAELRATEVRTYVRSHAEESQAELSCAELVFCSRAVQCTCTC